MYFKTKKDSETGKKFAKIVEKLTTIVMPAVRDFAVKHNIKQIRQAHWVAYGGISAAVFKENADKSGWKLRKGESNEYFPSQKTAKGKEIYKELTALPVIEIEDLNSCVNFLDQAPFITIGFAYGNEDYFGFEASEKWKEFTPPEDCEEITTKEYKELFCKDQYKINRTAHSLPTPIGA